MKNNKVINLKDYKKEIRTQIQGNLALKEEIEKPKVLKLVIGKSENKIFCGCWQVANGQDAC